MSRMKCDVVYEKRHIQNGVKDVSKMYMVNYVFLCVREKKYKLFRKMEYRSKIFNGYAINERNIEIIR